MSDRLLVLVEDSQSGACRRFALAARQFGVEPVMLAKEPDKMPYLTANSIRFIALDTDDTDEVIALCDDLSRASTIVGATTASERYYATAARICRHLHIPGPDPEAIERCRNKFAQRRNLRKAGVSVPAHRLAPNISVATDAAIDIGLPVVVKPVTGNASYGVKLCQSLKEVAAQTALLLAGKHGLPPPPFVLVEEFAKGPFFTVSTIGMDVAAITSATFSELPYFAMREFVYPTQLNQVEQEALALTARRSIRALGLGWGPANTEIRYTDRGPIVIEVNPRIVGAPEPDLIRLGSGIDLHSECLKLFLDASPDLQATRSDVAAVRWLMIEHDGIVDSIAGLEDARAIKDVVQVSVDVKPGTALLWHGDFRDVIGCVMAVSPTAERTRAALNKAANAVRISTLPLAADQQQIQHLKAS